jgi:hypothetical protein
VPATGPAAPDASNAPAALRHVAATTYATPFREGGSLPGLVEASDDGMYVVKFRGAGQGTAALIAEVVVGELGRALGVRVPELVIIDIDPQIARHEPDEEVQELLAASTGANLGVDFLPGSVGYTGVSWQPPASEAIAVAWLDALTGNVDRSWRNPNLLIWHRALWAIDPGAALVFQHAWPDVSRWAQGAYGLADHVLTPVLATARAADAGAWAAAGERLAAAVTPDLIDAVLEMVPDDWLTALPALPAEVAALPGPERPAALRAAYARYLAARLAARDEWWVRATLTVTDGAA